ncbi:MAG: TIGR04100 family radical SAM protein [Lachnospiraceae bacterium]
MSMTILYEVHDNLYVNLTNQCSCACTFCLRQTRDHMENSGVLWLDREPTAEEVKQEFAKFDMNKYKEVVFCGFGEPTMRLDVLLEVAEFVKKTYDKPTRINTNGLADLVYGEPVAPRLKGLIDTVSISLNTPNKERYYELTRNRFGLEAFDAMLAFASDCTKYVPHVVMTTVSTTLTKEEEDECAAICKKLGVTYRIRPWED